MPRKIHWKKFMSRDLSTINFWPDAQKQTSNLRRWSFKRETNKCCLDTFDSKYEYEVQKLRRHFIDAANTLRCSGEYLNLFVRYRLPEKFYLIIHIS